MAPGPSTAAPATTPLAEYTSKPPVAANHRTRIHSDDEQEEDETSETDGPPNKKVSKNIRGLLDFIFILRFPPEHMLI